MIPFDFEYYKPQALQEVNEIYQHLKGKFDHPMFYGGGTEIISMARMNNIITEAVIDIKAIPECKELHITNGKLHLGAALTLTEISESNVFPLLSKTVKRIADHTIQGKITLGGNVCATIIYRSSVLPLLLCDSEVVISGRSGIRTVSLNDIFDKRIQLQNGEFIVKFVVNQEYLNLPYSHAKITKQEKIDYPLLTCAALKKDSKVRIGFSGLCDFPFRSKIIEEILNKQDIPIQERVKDIVSNLPGLILSDISGSAEYRIFVLNYVIKDTLLRLEGNNV